MSNLDYDLIAEEIYKSGFYQIPSYFNEKKLSTLKDFSLDLRLKGPSFMRSFDHPVYQYALSNDLMDLLFGIANARLTIDPKLVVHSNCITPDNISISFARKGPSFNNSAPSPSRFHYDSSLVNAVLTLQVPPLSSSGSGLYIYKNLKQFLGRGCLSKIISRLLGRIAFIRFFYQPQFVNYTVGTLTLFYGDVTLHGVGSCYDGDRLSITYNLSTLSLARYNQKYNLIPT